MGYARTDARTPHGRTKTIFLVNGFKTPALRAGHKPLDTAVSVDRRWGSFSYVTLPSTPVLPYLPLPTSPTNSYVDSSTPRSAVVAVICTSVKFAYGDVVTCCDGAHPMAGKRYSSLFRLAFSPQAFSFPTRLLATFGQKANVKS